MLGQSRGGCPMCRVEQSYTWTAGISSLWNLHDYTGISEDCLGDKSRCLCIPSRGVAGGFSS